MLTTLLQRAGLLSQRRDHHRFRAALRQPERAQRDRLCTLLSSLVNTRQLDELGIHADSPYEEFRRRVPVQCYEDVADRVRAQRAAPGVPILAPDILRYSPTSGSTSSHKWIPITRQFGRELDAAAAAWLVDLAARYPGIANGRHYWSLSWLPDTLRAQGGSTDDLDFLPPLRRWFLGRIMAVPGEVARLRRSGAARLAMLAHLAADPSLRLFSVWSPTFLIRLLEELSARREEVAAILGAGSWEAGWSPELGEGPSWRAPKNPAAARWLRRWDGALAPGVFASLWPRLTLLSAWDSSTSIAFAEQLRALFPGVSWQGKGLWATEGVVSIPFAGRYPLALTSHFLEFRRLDDGEILPAWKLEPGQELQPILTTGSGLLRYVLEDRVLVLDPLERAPCIRFLGRLAGTDMVGEKVDARLAGRVLSEVEGSCASRPLSLLAVAAKGVRPFYVALIDASHMRAAPAEVASAVESALQGIHHYELARDLGQLDPAGVLVAENALALYEQIVGAGERVVGGLKIESVVGVEGEVADFVHSRVEPTSLLERSGEQS